MKRVLIFCSALQTSLAINSVESLTNSWLGYLNDVSVESSGPLNFSFQDGRCTNYAYNQMGSCGFGPIFPDESLGNPLSILAIPNCAPVRIAD